MTPKELELLLKCDESYRIERTISLSNMDKFQEAICAFANDLPGSGKKGYLLIGVEDKGKLSGLKVDDKLMVKISSIRSDGNILPLPTMNVEKVSMPDGDVLVVEVTPSFDTPVRYRGRTFVRIGPRRDIATPDEERILIERHQAALPNFDMRPCREATLDDLEVEAIVQNYLPLAIAPEIIAEDSRPVKEQLASLRLFNLQHDCPTYGGLILFGKDPKYFMMGNYVQYVRFDGDNPGATIANQREFRGNIFKMLPRLESFIVDAIITERPVPVSLFREKNVYNYPNEALRELTMNAVMHRDYQSNMPIRIYQYNDRVEIMNPGGLYGKARPENFPNVNDYRNPVVAEAMKLLRYVNMFNHGVQNVQALLKANGSKEADFDVSLLTVFKVDVEDANVTDQKKGIESSQTWAQAWAQISTQVSTQVKELIIKLKTDFMGLTEMIKLTKFSPSSRNYFRKKILKPAIELGLIELEKKETPNSPKQRYRLTELGLEVKAELQKEQEK